MKKYINRFHLRLKTDSPTEFSYRVAKVLYHQSIRRLAKKIIYKYIIYFGLTISKIEDKYSSPLWKLDDEIEGTREKLSKINQDPGVMPAQRFSPREQKVTELTDCYVIGPNSTTIKDTNIVLETISFEPVKPTRQILKDIENRPKKLAKCLLDLNPETEENIERAAVINSSYTNYFHWVLEHLLKLRGLEKYEKETGKNVKLIIPSDTPSYIKESLNLLAPEKEKIEASEGVIHVEKLILPSAPELTPKNLNWLKNKGLKNAEEPPIKPSKIYISRQSSQVRKVDNFNEIEKTLKKYSIKTIEMEKYSFQEQIGMIKNSNLLIGPHGAGLTNMIWGSELKIIELFNIHKPLHYKVLSKVLGHNYTKLSGKTIGDSKHQERNRNIKVNKKKLESILNEVIEDN